MMTSIDYTSSTYSSSIITGLQLFGNYLGLTDTDPRIIIAHLTRVAIEFTGIILIIMILWSGVNFMTAGGNEERATEAKKRLANAVIGPLIILSAYSIVRFIITGLIIATTNTTAEP